METLTLKNVSAKIGSFRIENVSFSVEEGEILVILGENGAGKTKLLETIAGFNAIDSGEITLYGTEITSFPPAKREIGFISETLALFPHMSVRKNILYGTKYRNIKDGSERFSNLVKTFDLENLLDRFPDTLSTGEKQKVTLARTLIVDPKIVLLDEPTSAISIRERERIDSEIRATLKRFHKSSIFVTHDENEAFTIGDRMAIMDNGRILQTGKAEEIFYHPSSEKIATFLGETNIFTGNVTGKGDGTIIVGMYGFKIIAVGNFEVGSIVKIFIRPEDVLLMNSPYETSARNILHGRVIKVTPRGLLMKVILDVGVMIMAFVTRSSADEMNLKVGTDLYVEIKATSIHIVEEG